MKILAITAVLAAAALAAATAFANDPAGPGPRRGPAARGHPAPPPAPPMRVLSFDLDEDGRVTWDEYQKGITGFARLDVDQDGAITKEDLEAVEAQHAREAPPPFRPGMPPPPGAR